jgi:hypothetical protein
VLVEVLCAVLHAGMSLTQAHHLQHASMLGAHQGIFLQHSMPPARQLGQAVQLS